MILSSSSPTDIGVVIIILGQSTSNKVQRSISHTPEGTDTAGERLIAGERIAISIVNTAGIRSINLRRRPIAGGGEGVPVGSTDITRIL